MRHELEERIGFAGTQPVAGPQEDFRSRDYINLKFAARGLPIVGEAEEFPFLEMGRGLILNFQERLRLLKSHRCPVDRHITEWLDRYPDSAPLQHVSSWEEDFDGAVARARTAGWEMIQEGRSSYGPFAYLEHADDPTWVFEITRKGPERRSIFEQIAAAAVAWDGSGPIREGWPKAQV